MQIRNVYGKYPGKKEEKKKKEQHLRKSQILPIVSIAKEECTKMKVEQLASTLATSAVAMALPAIERPGHP